MSPKVGTFSSEGSDADSSRDIDFDASPSPWGGKFDWDFEEPQAFPEAVDSYIGARVNIERRTSAAGPRHLPDVDTLHTSDKKRGSMSFSKTISSGMQAAEVSRGLFCFFSTENPCKIDPFCRTAN